MRKNAIQLAKDMENHVNSRGGPATTSEGELVIENGAWSMMLDASTTIRELVDHIEYLENLLCMSNDEL